MASKNSKTEKSKTPKTNVKKTKQVIKDQPDDSEFLSPDVPKRTGRRDLYLEKVKPFLKDIRKYARCGCTEEQIRAFYKVGHTAWNKYKKEHDELKEALLEGKREFKTGLLNSAYEVAMGYTYTEIDRLEIYDEMGDLKETRITTHEKKAKADAGMIMFLLINRFSDEYARDPHMVEIRKKAMELAEEGKLSLETEAI